MADSEDCLSWENRLKSLGSFTTKLRDTVCVYMCVCAHSPFYKSVHVCLILFLPCCHLCPKRDILLVPPRGLRIFLQTSSWLTGEETGWSKQMMLWQGSLISPLPLLFDGLLFGSDPCWTVCHSYKHLQACRTTNTPKEYHRLWGFVLLLMVPVLESSVGVYSNCLLMPVARTIPSHQTAGDGWLN